MATDLDELERLAKSATPGPWTASQTYPPDGYAIHAAGIPWQLAYVSSTLGANTSHEWPIEANASHIAAANPATVLALIADLRATRSRLAEMEVFIEAWRDRVRRTEDRLDAAVKVIEPFAKLAEHKHLDRTVADDDFPLHLGLMNGNVCQATIIERGLHVGDVRRAAAFLADKETKTDG